MTIGNFTVPNPAGDPDLVTQSITINGQTMGADVSEAVSDGQLDRTILGASTFTLTVEDPYRSLLRSQLFITAGTTCELSGLSFTLAAVQKSSDQLVLTFEDTIVNRLRGNTDPYNSQALTRADFIKAVIRKTPGIQAFVYDSGEPLKTALAKGGSNNPGEDSWTCIQRLANEVQWRAFSDGEAIYVGPDPWLLAQPSRGVFSEFTGGVDFIDFDFDVNKPLTQATINCVASLWEVPPGQPLELAGMGIGDGLWLVEDISRSIFVQDTVITVTQPVQPLPEGSSSSSTIPAGTTAIGDLPIAADAVGSAVVAFAKSALGTNYVWGGESPSGYDCSGLAQAAYRSAGVSIPRTSETQFAAGPAVSLAALEPGDLVFFGGNGYDGTPSSPGHVGIYVGNNQMIDVPHTGAKVRYDSVAGAVGATRPR